MEKMEQERPYLASLIDPIAISPADLEALAAMASSRFLDAHAEHLRTALLDDVHRAGLDAGRLFGGFVRHLMSESRGTPTAFDIAEEARVCYGALGVYVAAIGRARDGFDDLVALRVEDGGAAGGVIRADAGRSACA